MALVTTLIAPVFLKWGVMKACGPDEKAAFCTLWDEASKAGDEQK